MTYQTNYPSLAATEAMDRSALIALWQRVYTTLPPPKTSQVLMRQMLAFEMQAKAQGGLTKATKHKLKKYRQILVSGQLPNPAAQSLSETERSPNTAEGIQSGYIEARSNDPKRRNQAHVHGQTPNSNGIESKRHRASKSIVRRQSKKLKPGARLMREWNGHTHIVEVEAKSYIWQGQAFGSLSAVAKAITSAHWSGPRFFGI